VNRPDFLDSSLLHPVWPAGVIGRYLTVGGATVDITHADSHDTASNIGTCQAKCLGCDATDWTETYSQPRNDEEDCRIWAQGHASYCRAMPNPEVAR
jgi:hypothetical protein